MDLPGFTEWGRVGARGAERPPHPQQPFLEPCAMPILSPLLTHHIPKLWRSWGEAPERFPGTLFQPLPELPGGCRALPGQVPPDESSVKSGCFPPRKHPQSTLTPSEPADPQSRRGRRCRPLRGSPSCACRDRRDREGDGSPRHVWHGMSGMGTCPHTRDTELRGTQRVFAPPSLSLPLRACKARVPPVRAGTHLRRCAGTRAGGAWGHWDRHTERCARRCTRCQRHSRVLWTPWRASPAAGRICDIRGQP